MKKILKLITILLIIAIVAPLTIVHATTSRTEQILEKLNAADVLTSNNGQAKYEDDEIEIEYYTTNSSFKDLYFSYEGTVIEYDASQITNYEEAEDASSHYMYAIQLITSALKLNGYTQEQIRTYMQSDESNPTFENNGFEIQELGTAQTFTSDDDTTTIQVTPMLFRIDVSKANLNPPNTVDIEIKDTTVEDIVEDLNSNESFTSYKDEDGKLIYENEVTLEDEYIEIVYTYYNYDYHNLYFDCVDDVLTYEIEEIENYDEAASAIEHEMWALFLLQYALELNGYEIEEIREYFNAEDSNPTFEKNGIEIKELGEVKKFEGEQEETISMTPISIKVDFVKANIDKEIEKAEILEGKDQTFDKEKGGKLTFKFSFDYDAFVKEGKVFVDNKEVSKDKYTLSKGSTIVTFNDDFTKDLSEGKHTIVASIGDNEVEADFTVTDTKTENIKQDETKDNTASNPKTSDNIIIFATLLIISVIGIAITTEFAKKEK